MKCKAEIVSSTGLQISSTDLLTYNQAVPETGFSDYSSIADLGVAFVME